MAPIYLDSGGTETVTVERKETFGTILIKLRGDIAAEDNFRPDIRFTPITKGQRGGLLGLLNQYLGDHKDDRDRRIGILEFVLGKGVGSTNDLSKWQASLLISIIKVPSKTEGPREPWVLSRKGKLFLRYCERTSRGIDCDSKVFEPEWSSEPAVELGYNDADVSNLPEADSHDPNWKWRP